jgi:hypothetical protein
MSTREKIAKLGVMAATIEARQESDPGYAESMLRQIVNAELAKIERETLRYWAETEEL